MYDPTNLPPAKHVKRRNRKPAIIAVAAVVGLLLCCGVIGSLATLVGPKPAANFITPTTPPASVLPSTAPASTKPAEPVATTKPAALSPAQQLRAWYDTGGQDHLTAVANALGKVSDTTQAGDVEGAKVAALGLGVAVKSAQGFAPMPDPTAQRFWTAALTEYGKAAQDLYVGLTTVDVDKIQQATNEMGDGAVELRHCTDRIHQLTGA